MMARPTPEQAFETRKKYVDAFNDTQIKIWKEKIVQLGVIDTGRLYNYVVETGLAADGRYTSVTLSQGFALYGLYQDRGTGREVPAGNPGNIGRVKVRERRPWFRKKYWSSFYNLQDFFADNLGREAALGIASVFE